MENKEKELIKNFESLSKFIEENDIPALILIKTNEDHFSATISNIDDITELFAKQSHNDDDLGHALSYIATLTMASQCSMNHRKFFEFQRNVLAAIKEYDETFNGLFNEDEEEEVDNKICDC